MLVCSWTPDSLVCVRWILRFVGIHFDKYFDSYFDSHCKKVGQIVRPVRPVRPVQIVATADKMVVAMVAAMADKRVDKQLDKLVYMRADKMLGSLVVLALVIVLAAAVVCLVVSVSVAVVVVVVAVAVVAVVAVVSVAALAALVEMILACNMLVDSFAVVDYHFGSFVANNLAEMMAGSRIGMSADIVVMFVAQEHSSLVVAETMVLML